MRTIVTALTHMCSLGQAAAGLVGSGPAVVFDVMPPYMSDCHLIIRGKLLPKMSDISKTEVYRAQIRGQVSKFAHHGPVSRRGGSMDRG
jgi:hypothetical protein